MEVGASVAAAASTAVPEAAAATAIAAVSTPAVSIAPVTATAVAATHLCQQTAAVALTHCYHHHAPEHFQIIRRFCSLPPIFLVGHDANIVPAASVSFLFLCFGVLMGKLADECSAPELGEPEHGHFSSLLNVSPGKLRGPTTATFVPTCKGNPLGDVNTW